MRRLGPAAALTLALVIALRAGALAQHADDPLVAPAPDPFVHVAGDHFVRGGQPMRFLGTNVAVMHGEAHRAGLASTLDGVAADGLDVIRVWALGERDASSPAWARSYAFRVGEDAWVEESFAHLDHVLVEAAARHLGVIVVLANRWADYGGIPQYLRWSGDPFDASARDGLAQAELGTFFRSERARALYLAHVERVVGRTNGLTGVAYADDPTIVAWELVNEISAERRDASSLASFVAQSARRVRAIDRHHLLSAGHVGYVTSADRRTWREIMAMPEVDYADAHAYPTEHDRVRTLDELDAFVDDHVRLAHDVLGKPLVLGEVGFASGRRALARTRPRLFDHFLEHAARAGVDGALTWIYAPSSDRAGPHTILADHPDADSARVRAVLRARGVELRGPRPPEIDAPGAGASDTRLWDASRTIRGSRRTAVARAGVVVIAPEQFAEARFETLGSYAGGAIAHVYGGGYGWVRYRFRAPRRLGSALRVSVRASSELPGAGVGRDARDGSRVLVFVDDELLGVMDVPPDDGIGRVVSLEVPIDEALAGVFGRPRVHTLRFEVEDDDDAHGLCLYGRATGLEPVDPGVAAELPGRIEIAFLP